MKKASATDKGFDSSRSCSGERLGFYLVGLSVPLLKDWKQYIRFGADL